MRRMKDPAARGEGIVLSYNHRVAVAESTFSIPAGRLTAVIGPNGSGKSTLLHALTGLVRVGEGTIEVFGGPARAARQRVAYVLQSTKVNEVMPVTVREVVAMGRYAGLGRFRRFRRRDALAVERALERLQIVGLAGSHLTELSGGQRRRVFVAQGLVQEADLLLLDEPVTGLDIVSRDLIVTAMTEELQQGRTVVFTTHDLAEAGEADHVILMSGRVAASGTPAEVLMPDRLSAAYGIGIVHLEDGSIALDDAAHVRSQRHVHYERGTDRA
jgi:iron complex transport system ATP-binding protein